MGGTGREALASEWRMPEVLGAALPTLHACNCVYAVDVPSQAWQPSHRGEVIASVHVDRLGAFFRWVSLPAHVRRVIY